MYEYEYEIGFDCCVYAFSDKPMFALMFVY